MVTGVKKTSASDVERLAGEIQRFLTGTPRFFAEVVALAGDGQYRTLLQAWGVVRKQSELDRDEEGRYVIRPAAKGEGA